MTRWPRPWRVTTPQAYVSGGRVYIVDADGHQVAPAAFDPELAAFIVTCVNRCEPS